MNSVGNNIVKYMKAKGIKTQAELARKSKLSNQGISDILTGKKNPNIITLSKIASALSVNTRDLLANDNCVRETEEQYGLDLTPEIKAIINWANDADNYIYLEFAKKLSEIFTKEEISKFDVYTFAKIFKLLILEGKEHD